MELFTPESEQDDPEKLLNTWLNELDSLAVGLESIDGSKTSPLRPLSNDLNSPRIDSYRFSMANMEESQDIDLDAILCELTALGTQYDEAINASKNETTKDDIVGKRANERTHSPDNDSAFSDSVSLLSSESSASSGRSELHSQVYSTSKAEKIRLALQKMKDASVKKLFIKVFSQDGSGKSLLVDEGMNCGYVTRVLAEKNHVQLDPQCALVEHLTDLHMERVYEDHEPLVEQLMLWTRDSKNKLLFCDRPNERTLLFSAPHLFLGPTTGDNTPVIDHFANTQLLEEFFSGSGVPSVEGPLYIKTESRKGWKRHHCILRASGLYFWPKDKAKSSSKDLICLATFDVNHVYYGIGWKKKYKAPTEFCFAIKHPCLQQPKSSKYIKYLCAEDLNSMHRWVTAIRVIKYGRQLLVNYRSVVEECQLLAQERAATESNGTLISGAASDSDSSGCDVGFECDFPSGTIKRKPAKIPLTATTRQLKEIAISSASPTPVILERTESVESLPPPPPELLVDDPDVDGPHEEPPPPPPPRLAAPSTAFLQDLQRVMKRKWQVAERCKIEPSTTPHEVLGFRDPRESSVSKEADVRNWVKEHYGPSLYENVYKPAGPHLPPVRKRPPPPPPRAVTTHLTTVQHNC